MFVSLYMRVCFRVKLGADLGHRMQSFSIFRQQQEGSKANSSFSFSRSLSQSVFCQSVRPSLEISCSTRSLEMGGPQPKVSSIDTQPLRFGCVCVFDLLLFVFRRCIGDSWSLAVCEQSRVRMRTARVSRLGEQCLQPDVDRGTLSSPG